MLGLDPKVAEHCFSVDPLKKSIWQKRRVFAPERQQIIYEEVAKLLRPVIIFEIDYPEWLANVVLGRRQMRSDGCAWTIVTLIRPAEKIFIPCLILTK